MNTRTIIYVFLIVINISSCAAWPKDPVNDPESNFEVLWQEFSDCYALFDVKGVDWDQVYSDYRPLVSQNSTDEELFAVFISMLTLLNDTHVKISSPFDYFKSGQGYNTDQFFSINVVKNNYLTNPKSTSGDYFTYGYLTPEIGYIHISTMTSGETTAESYEKWVEPIDSILKGFSNTSALVIDVRHNGGGLPANAKYIAGRFTDKERIYNTSYTKNGPGKNDFGPAIVNSFLPGGTYYSNPVVLLTDNNTASAAEDFTLAMNTIPNVIHMGSPTTGILSLALKRELQNGWVYTISVQKILDNNGVCPEGTGILPNAGNIIYNTNAEIEAGIDNQLASAITFLES